MYTMQGFIQDFVGGGIFFGIAKLTLDGHTTVYIQYMYMYNVYIVDKHTVHVDTYMYMSYLLVKVPCECIMENIARGCGREQIKHEALPSALPRPECYIFRNARARTVLYNWFIVAAFLASAALNDSKWALQSKLPPTMPARSRGKTGEPL